MSSKFWVELTFCRISFGRCVWPYGWMGNAIKWMVEKVWPMFRILPTSQTCRGHTPLPRYTWKGHPETVRTLSVAQAIYICQKKWNLMRTPLIKAVWLNFVVGGFTLLILCGLQFLAYCELHCIYRGTFDVFVAQNGGDAKLVRMHGLWRETFCCINVVLGMSGWL